MPSVFGEKVPHIQQPLPANIAIEDDRFNAATRPRIHPTPLIGLRTSGYGDVAAIGPFEYVLEGKLELAPIGEQDINPEGVDHHQVDGDLAVDPHDPPFVPEHVKPGGRAEQQPVQAVFPRLITLTTDLLYDGEEATLAAKGKLVQPGDQRIE